VKAAAKVIVVMRIATREVLPVYVRVSDMISSLVDIVTLALTSLWITAIELAS
jgi:hypothetical protein